MIRFAGPEGEFYSFHDKCFELKVQKYVTKHVESICFMNPLGVALSFFLDTRSWFFSCFQCGLGTYVQRVGS